MPAYQSPQFQFQAISDQTNLPLSFGLLYTYISGTTTPQATYTDQTGLTAAANPVVLNIDGKANLYLGAGLNYRFDLWDATNLFHQTDYPVDNISASSPSGVTTAVNALSLGGIPAASYATYAELASYATYAELASTAAGQGAALVGFTQPLAGAPGITIQQAESDWVSVWKFFTPAQFAAWLAAPQTYDVTAIIQLAINGTYGGTLFFPPGYYLISQAGSNPWCLQVLQPIRLMGAGPRYTSIVPNASTPAAVNILNLTPNASLYDYSFSGIDKLCFGNPFTGTCAGGHTIYVAATPGNLLSKFVLRDNYFSTTAAGYYSFYLYSTNTTTGGLVASLFEFNFFAGGIYLLGGGDSNVIKHNVTTGPNYNIYVSNCAGASTLSFEDNNCTAYLGTKIDYCPRISIRHNEFEMVLAGCVGSNGAIIDFNNSSATSFGGEIRGNLLSGGGSSPLGLTTGLRIKNTNGLHIEDNVFLSGNAYMVTAILLVDNSAANTRIGPNTYDAGFTLPNSNWLAWNSATTYPSGAYCSYLQQNWVSLQGTNLNQNPITAPTYWALTAGPRILDNGYGTCGVVHPLTLQNAWVPYGSSRSVPQYYKDLSGVVHLSGAVANGSATNVAITTLPSGFRPTALQTFAVFSLAGATTGLGGIQVYDTTSGSGAVMWYATGGNTLMSLDGVSFMAAGMADGVSSE